MTEKSKIITEDQIFNEFMRIKTVGDTPFLSGHVDKKLMFKHYLNQIQPFIKSWMNSLSSEQQSANLLKSPGYAFIHYIAQNEFPLDYASEVCVRILDKRKLERSGLSEAQYIKSESENFNFHDAYGQIMCCVVDIELDAYASAAIDTSEMLKEYREKPISDHEDVNSEWTDLFVTQLVLIAEAIAIAVSIAVSKNLSTVNLPK